jgi:hypothetical protein
MAQRRIDFLSLMYKKSSDPGNSPTASRQCNRRPGAGASAKGIVGADGRRHLNAAAQAADRGLLQHAFTGHAAATAAPHSLAVAAGPAVESVVAVPVQRRWQGGLWDRRRCR